jgi:hypothetical protein
MSALDQFGGYQKALELFDHAVNDMALLQKDPRCYRLNSIQRLRSEMSATPRPPTPYTRPSTLAAHPPTPDTRHPTR